MIAEAYLIGYTQKEAAGKGVVTNFLRNPAGGAGLKGGLEQGVNKAVDWSAPLGIAGGVNLYSNNPDAKATSAATAILAPWLATRTRGRFREAVKDGHKGMAIPTEMLSKMTPELVAKMGLGGGAAAFDYGMKKGPEIAQKLESGVDSFQQVGENTAKVTKDVSKVTAGAQGDLTKGLKNLGSGVGSLGKDMKDTGKHVNKALKNVGDSVGDFGMLAKTVTEKMKQEEGGNFDLTGVSTVYNDVKKHLSDNWKMYALGAGGIVGVAGLAMMLSSNRKREEEEEKARQKEREIRALNRMGRALEDA
jgi:hypothetical protein